MLDYGDKFALTGMLLPLQKHFGVGPEAFGNLIMAQNLALALSSPLWGWLADIGIGKRFSIGPLDTTAKGRVGYDGTFRTDKPFWGVEIETEYSIKEGVTLLGPVVKLIKKPGHKITETGRIFGTRIDF